MIRIAAIDDDRMLLQGLAAWMEPLEDVLLATVAVTVAVTVADFIETGSSVDVVLLDLNLRDDSQPAENVRQVLATGAAVLVVLRKYASGATLAATARKAGVAYGTAREYLERVKRKYSDAGWPTRTKLDLVDRLREEDLGP